ncbi:cyclic GMP-AMP synthase DncV-like nucleotidyltransferase [Methylobacterium sp. SI9]|uniref:cyclic GMP-AMP synthase DncV-like nucleotidyltransferase n=1 Tax=Methylobacterium guangdongense TaxID=3138811 RepID=UPI00313E500A
MTRDTNEQLRRFHGDRVWMDAMGRRDIYGKAKSNRNRLRNGLARDGKPTPVGSATQGSYAMRTMIQNDDGDYDVDDGVYFAKEDLVSPNGGVISALAARQMVCDALQDRRFSEKPEVRNNCVRIQYAKPNSYHVDVPIYRRNRTKHPYTGVITDKYELASADWKESDALNVTKWFKKRNEETSGDTSRDGDKGQFVRVVRLVKAFARSRPHWSGKIAGGFALSRLVSDHFVESVDRDDVALRNVLRAIQDRLAWKDWVAHPTLNENILPVGSAKAKFLRKKLGDKLPLLDVLDAPNCTHELAMKAWDKFFLSDWFTNQPDPDDEDELDSKTTRGPTIKVGGQGYA